MTEETFFEIVRFAMAERRHNPDNKCPIVVGQDVLLGEPEYSGLPFAIGIRVHPGDFADLNRMVMDEELVARAIDTAVKNPMGHV